MFEHYHEPLIPKTVFYKRFSRSVGIGIIIIFCSLFLGILGYHFTEGIPWLDSLLNASMILSGMGPVQELHTASGKLFASFYALFSGVAFITSVGVIFAPVFHRFLHKFHLESVEDEDDNQSDTKKI